MEAILAYYLNHMLLKDTTTSREGGTANPTKRLKSGPSRGPFAEAYQAHPRACRIRVHDQHDLDISALMVCNSVRTLQRQVLQGGYTLEQRLPSQ